MKLFNINDIRSNSRFAEHLHNGNCMRQLVAWAGGRRRRRVGRQNCNYDPPPPFALPPMSELQLAKLMIFLIFPSLLIDNAAPMVRLLTSNATWW